MIDETALQARREALLIEEQQAKEQINRGQAQVNQGNAKLIEATLRRAEIERLLELVKPKETPPTEPKV